jgi:hypothetical protein
MKDKHLDYVMGVVEASELWGLSAGYIKNLCATGEVEAKKIGNIWVLEKGHPNPKKEAEGDVPLVAIREPLREQMEPTPVRPSAPFWRGRFFLKRKEREVHPEKRVPKPEQTIEKVLIAESEDRWGVIGRGKMASITKTFEREGEAKAYFEQIKAELKLSDWTVKRSGIRSNENPKDSVLLEDFEEY